MNEKDKTKEETKIKSNTNNYNRNKLRYVPKADIEMMREEQYEKTGIKKQKKYKY